MYWPYYPTYGYPTYGYPLYGNPYYPTYGYGYPYNYAVGHIAAMA